VPSRHAWICSGYVFLHTNTNTASFSLTILVFKVKSAVERVSTSRSQV